MIEWLVQSTSAHPELARGCPPAGLLDTSELERFRGLKTEKRRRDWLLGRWTAKHLVQSYLARIAGLQVPLDAIVVASDSDGAPRLQIAACRLQIADTDPNLQSAIYNLQSLSISHCDGRSLCAISGRPAVKVGVDIEKIEPRDPGFAADYFTAMELKQLRAVPPRERDAMATVIWSNKEAALKALRLGLTVDTRSLSCALSRPDQLQPGWAPFTMSCNPALLGRRVDRLGGWWRQKEGYVLTIAILCPGSAFPS